MAVRFRRLFQFSLRSMLLLAVLVGLVCGAILIPAARSRRELPVIARIEKRGGTAVRSFVPTPAIEFAARFLGQEPFLRVTEVSLTESGATDADLVALGSLGELRKLDLSHTYVTDEGLARLAIGLPELRELNLTLANIGPRGLAALAGNANLETVYTLGTATDYADLEALAKKLPGVPLVEQRARQEAEELGGEWDDDHSVQFTWAEFEEDELSRLFIALGRHPSLWRLDFDEDTKRLPVPEVSKLASLRSLRLAFDSEWPDFTPLARLPHLRELAIEGNPEVIPAAGLAWLNELRNLRALSLKGILSGPQIELLRPFTNLRSLALGGSYYDDRKIYGIDLEPLAGLTALEELELRDTPIDDEGLRTFAGFSSLRRLVLTGTRVRGPGLAHLRGCQQLAELDLSDTPFDDQAMSDLAHFPRLTTLDLSQTRVTEQGLRALPVSLRTLILHSTAVSIGACRELVRDRPDLKISFKAPWGRYAWISAKGTNTMGAAAVPDNSEGTWRLQAREWLFSGDFVQMAHAYSQAGAMPYGALGDYHRAAFAHGLDGNWKEASTALEAGNDRALKELEAAPASDGWTNMPMGFHSFTLGWDLPAKGVSYGAHSVGGELSDSLDEVARLGLDELHDPQAVVDSMSPVLLATRGRPECDRVAASVLRQLSGARQALGEPVAAVQCLVEAREREIAERIQAAQQAVQDDEGGDEVFDDEKDPKPKPLAERWRPDDPEVRLATLYASLAGEERLPDVPVLGLVSEAQPLVIDTREERCWKFAWSERDWNDFALVPPPGQAFAELSIVCEVPRDEHLCPVTCWIGNRTDDWLDPAHLTERVPGERAQGQPLVLEVPFDVPLVWLRLGEYAHRAVVSVRLRPRGQGKPAPPRVGGLEGFLASRPGGTFTLDGEPLPTGVPFERVLPPGPHELEFRGDDGKTRRRTLDIVSDATLPLFEHEENPFRATGMPLPIPRGLGNRGGTLAHLPDGSLLVAYTRGEYQHERIVLASRASEGGWSNPWEFAHGRAGPTEQPSLAIDADGRVWIAYGGSLPSARGVRGREASVWLCNSRDGRAWSSARPIRAGDRVGWPEGPRLTGVRGRQLLLTDSRFFAMSDSPEQLREFDRQIAPLRGEHANKVESYEDRFVDVDAQGRMHVVLGSSWPTGTPDAGDERYAYGLFYSYSDDLRHWAPLQLVQLAESFSPTSFSLRGDRAAVIYFGSDRTWLWRGKVAENRLSMEPPVPIFIGFGAGPLICDGDKCSLVFTREGCVPCLLEANADDVFGTSSADRP